MSQRFKKEGEPQRNCMQQHKSEIEVPGLKKKDGFDSFVNTYFEFALLSISPNIGNEMVNKILDSIAEFVTPPNSDQCSKLTLQSDVFECPECECHGVDCDSGLFCDICMKMFCQECMSHQCQECNNNICIECICENRAKMCQLCTGMQKTFYCGKCVKSGDGLECTSCDKFFCGDCAEDLYSNWNDEYVCQDCDYAKIHVMSITLKD